MVFMWGYLVLFVFLRIFDLFDFGVFVFSGVFGVVGFALSCDVWGLFCIMLVLFGCFARMFCFAIIGCGGFVIFGVLCVLCFRFV